MAIHEAIDTYLNAVEKKFGTDARRKTEVAHRGGNTFVLKRAGAKHSQVVDLGNLTLMAKHLQSNA